MVDSREEALGVVVGGWVAVGLGVAANGIHGIIQSKVMHITETTQQVMH